MTKSYSKKFNFEGRDFVIDHFSAVIFVNDFYRELYTVLFNKLVDGNCMPHIDCDDLIFGACGTDYYQIAIDNRVKLNQPSKKNPNKEREKLQIAIQKFCEEYPLFVTFLNNCRFRGAIAILHAETLIDEPCTIKNFIRIKTITGRFHKMNWTRQMDESEAQAGVSNLGNISENLLNKALSNLASRDDFSKMGNNSVKSYGDFVLMCLPNNLWISVKSAFSRERLLASGFGNDILAVGFFEQYTEFTSEVYIRNMRKAGFLCIYLPDVAITEEQEKNSTSTYDQLMLHFKTEGKVLPLNINGSQMIRPLTSIASDLDKLLTKDIERRFSIDV